MASTADAVVPPVGAHDPQSNRRGRCPVGPIEGTQLPRAPTPSRQASARPIRRYVLRPREPNYVPQRAVRPEAAGSTKRRFMGADAVGVAPRAVANQDRIKNPMAEPW
jgi:hypothetical protein